MRLLFVLVVSVLLALALFRRRAARWVRMDRERVFDEVSSALRFLEEEHGMKCTSRTYDERAFGNVIAVYEKPGLSFQLVRDRSQWFFSVWTDGVSELSESELLRRCGLTRDFDALVADRWTSLQKLADVARRNFVRFEQELDSLRAARTERST